MAQTTGTVLRSVVQVEPPKDPEQKQEKVPSEPGAHVPPFVQGLGVQASLAEVLEGVGWEAVLEGVGWEAVVVAVTVDAGADVDEEGVGAVDGVVDVGVGVVVDVLDVVSSQSLWLWSWVWTLWWWTLWWMWWAWSSQSLW